MEQGSPAMLTRSRSALGTPASPGGVSQLGALMQGLALAEGTAVGWCVALKPPKSSQVVVVDCAGDGKWQETSADAWLRDRLLHKASKGWQGAYG